MKLTQVFFLVLCALFSVSEIYGQHQGIYCNKETCYETLGLKNDAKKKDIQKAFRKMQMKYHPDRQKVTPTASERKAMSEKMDVILIAYETLKDDVERKKYDELLADPDKFYKLWYKKVGHSQRGSYQMNVFFVVVLVLGAISAAQFYFVNDSVQHKLRDFLDDDRIRAKFIQRAQDTGLLKAKGKMDRYEEKSKVIELFGDEICDDAGWQKIAWNETLWMSILKSPLTFPKGCFDFLVFHYKYTIMGNEYDLDAKTKLTKQMAKLTDKQWDSLVDDEKEGLINKELWKTKNYRAYQKELAEQAQRELMGSTQYKRQKKMEKMEKAGSRKRK